MEFSLKSVRRRISGSLRYKTIFCRYTPLPHCATTVQVFRLIFYYYGTRYTGIIIHKNNIIEKDDDEALCCRIPLLFRGAFCRHVCLRCSRHCFSQSQRRKRRRCYSPIRPAVQGLKERRRHRVPSRIHGNSSFQFLLSLILS